METMRKMCGAVLFMFAVAFIAAACAGASVKGVKDQKQVKRLYSCLSCQYDVEEGIAAKSTLPVNWWDVDNDGVCNTENPPKEVAVDCTYKRDDFRRIRVQHDNCPCDQNPDQLDNDKDRLGDLCDPDDDNDGVSDTDDNCKLTFNPGQENMDRDKLGDVCDNCMDMHADKLDYDRDGDGWCENDNCPNDYNRDQEDKDGDGTGDACEPKPLPPYVPPPLPDRDRDGVVDEQDNCTRHPNPNQEDLDGDSIGNPCDMDVDDDGVCDPAQEGYGNMFSCIVFRKMAGAIVRLEVFDFSCSCRGQPVDNCRLVPNPNQEDADRDGLGDACDQCESNAPAPTGGTAKR